MNEFVVIFGKMILMLICIVVILNGLKVLLSTGINMRGHLELSIYGGKNIAYLMSSLLAAQIFIMNTISFFE